eukprot:6180614-Pleurochrysis_carterae.AAC.5
MADEGTPLKGEYGPYIYKNVQRISKPTDSVPAGVQLMARFLDNADNPGVEDWLPPGKWYRRRVFHDINKWKYVKAQNTDTYKAQRAALDAWHSAYSTADSIPVGTANSRAPSKADPAPAASASMAAPALKSPSTAPLASSLKGNALRQA